MTEPTENSLPVLLVDDDDQLLHSCGVALRASGISPVITLNDSREVMPFLARRTIGVVVLDLSMPHVTGEELLPRIREEHPPLPVIVMTGMNEVDAAVRCMKGGAFDYFVKPVEIDRLAAGVRRAIELQALRGEVSSLKTHLLAPRVFQPEAFARIVTGSKTMFSLFKYIEAIAPTRQPVLITGETGVGKELFARAVHDLSRCAGAFMAVNVAGLDDTLFADTLFGHKRGAYTGADQAREGLIGRAAGGTMFLDEIGDLRESSQVKLLRLLEERQYYPLGSDVPKRSDARVVCCTHHDLKQQVKEGRFRNDLFYRLSAHHIQVPPLRERREDLPLLLDHLIDAAAASLEKKKPTPPAELQVLLSTYHFPGNVRELRSMVFDAVARHQSGILSLESFRRVIGETAVAAPAAAPPSPDGNVPMQLLDRFPTLKEVEEFLVAEALKRSGNNQGIAAGLLGMTRQALNKRLTRRGKSAA